MKNTSIPAIIMALIICFNTGCDKSGITPPPPPPPPPPCTGENHTYTKSINGFDFTFGSPYYNKAIVNFKFVQEQLACPSFTSSTSLVIQNLTTNTVSFDYSISFVLNYAAWNYQDVAVIPPLSSIDVGKINQNPARIDLGGINIQGQNITYY